MTQRGTGILAYIVAAFSISWTLWYGLARQGWEPGSSDLHWAVLQGAFAPALAAIAVRLWVDKGFADAGLRLNLRRSWKYYLLAWFLPLPGAALVLLLAQTLGLAEVDWTFRSGLAALEMPGLWGVVMFSLASAAITMPILFGEEFGWRGYLQQRIFRGGRDKPVIAAVITGCIWSLWHLPLNLQGYNFPGQPVAGAFVFTGSCILLSIIFGWFLAASGSIWCASLAHASTNAVGASLVLLATGGKPGIMAAYLGVLGWVPLGLLAAWIVATGRLRPAPEEPALAPGHEHEQDVL